MLVDIKIGHSTLVMGHYFSRLRCLIVVIQNTSTRRIICIDSVSQVLRVVSAASRGLLRRLASLSRLWLLGVVADADLILPLLAWVLLQARLELTLEAVGKLIVCIHHANGSDGAVMPSCLHLLLLEPQQ